MIEKLPNPLEHGCNNHELQNKMNEIIEEINRAKKIPSAYVIGRVTHGLKDDVFEGVDDDEIYLVMEKTPENLEHAQWLIRNYKPKKDEL